MSNNTVHYTSLGFTLDELEILMNDLSNQLTGRSDNTYHLHGYRKYTKKRNSKFLNNFI